MVKSCRRQPDSGNPTVRDEKRAEQKRESRGTVNPPHKPKGCVTETLFLKLHALLFYSTLAADVGGHFAADVASGVATQSNYGPNKESEI